MSSVKNLVLCALFAALITIGTYIKIPTPLLPLTFQTLFVVLAGLVLGKKYGALSVCVYVIAGLIGLPVFTGSALNPTFGYIIGFIPGAWLAFYHRGTGRHSRDLCFRNPVLLFNVEVLSWKRTGSKNAFNLFCLNADAGGYFQVRFSRINRSKIKKIRG